MSNAVPQKPLHVRFQEVTARETLVEAKASDVESREARLALAEISLENEQKTLAARELAVGLAEQSFVAKFNDLVAREAALASAKSELEIREAGLLFNELKSLPAPETPAAPETPVELITPNVSALADAAQNGQANPA